MEKGQAQSPLWYQEGSCKYMIRGAHPRLLLLSGTHGDENKTILSLQKIVSRFASILPDFLYIPEVSPSAVAAHTRRNKLGHDVNRTFFDSSTDMEVKTLIAILSPYTFDQCFSFHEDLERTEFYLYDNGNMRPSLMTALLTELATRSIMPYNGIDDPELGLMVHNGYVKHPTRRVSTGHFMDWSSANHKVKHCIEIETPGLLDQSDKDFIAEAVLHKLILPLSAAS